MTFQPVPEARPRTADMPTDAAAAPPLAPDDGEELLRQVLAQGFESNDTNPQVKRKLLETVFSACIFTPIIESHTLDKERAELALSILDRQLPKLPEVLLEPCEASGPGPAAAPLYAWLMSRIVIAMTHSEDFEGLRGFVEPLCESAVRILGVLGRDLPNGRPRFATVLRELRQYGEETKSTLLEYSDVGGTSDPLPQLFALHIALQTAGPYAADQQQALAVAIAQLARKFTHLSPTRQQRYAAVLSAAIGVLPVSHVLSDAVTVVARWPHVDDDRWHESVTGLLRSVDKENDTSLQRDVWLALYPQHSRLQLESPLARQKILLLLNPALPRSIGSMLSAEALDQWSAQSTGTDKDNADIRERLRLYCDMPHTSSLKRKRHDKDTDEALQMMRRTFPDLDRDILDKEEGMKQFGVTRFYQLLQNSRIACVMSQCEGSRHRPLPDAFVKAWISDWNSVQDDMFLMRALRTMVQHSNSSLLAPAAWSKVLWRSWRAMKSSERQIRVSGGLLISTIYAAIGREHRQPRIRTQIVSGVPALLKESLPVQETAVRLLGDLGRAADDKELAEIVEILIKQFGSKNSHLREIVYIQLGDIATYRNKTPYNLLLPYLDRISVLLAESLVTSGTINGHTIDFIGYKSEAFYKLEAPRKNVVPTLVLRQNRPALDSIAGILQQRLPMMLIEEAPNILAKVFLAPQHTDRCLHFVMSILGERVADNKSRVTVETYVRTQIVALVVNIMVELGGQSIDGQEFATQALHNVQRYVEDVGDLGSFLKPHMLGILHKVSEDLMMPKTTAHKVNIIRSIGKLIQLVGDSMASFSAQIIAILQGTLDVAELRLETLRTWHVFIDLLKFVDVGPFIGPTVAAIVENWDSFDDQQRGSATKIIAGIAGNATHLKAFQDDIVQFGHIEELAQYSNTLSKYRQSWTTKIYLDKLIDRANSNNLAVSTASMRELRDLLVQKYSDIVALVRGDAFDPVVGKLTTSLLGAATRDGDCDKLKDLTHQCFGLLGALDPDRFNTATNEVSMLVMSNFADHEESVNFAIHLIRDLLVGAFRRTNDTKHQNHLAFAIQQLLKFCNFDAHVARGGDMSTKVRKRWEELPRDVHQTITPLLGAVYSLELTKTERYVTTIYPQMKTYREWLQAWTVELIRRVMEVKAVDGLTDAQGIFGVFDTNPKNMDMAVAHHLLPHLVLHLLLTETTGEQIKLEIEEVLRDQLKPNLDNAPDKRMLSAQVVFQLMDHLSKWLRKSRLDNGRQSSSRPVEELLSSIDTSLVANAAMKSGAFARSLRNFEERIVFLRTKENRSDADLQTHFESLHEIYAELDEPDGMEGVSAFVVSPSLDLQIREHESTGRWTAAQSCWEVHLQHDPENVKFQVGLLRSLQNLGHYDSIRTHVRGVISNVKAPDMLKELVPFQAEAAWTIGDWDTVAQIQNPPPIAEVFLAIRQGKNVNEALSKARRAIGSTITTREYTRAYDAILQLHMLREVEMIYEADRSPHHSRNAEAIVRRQADDLVETLSARFGMALPVFRVHEEVLNKRRAAFSLMQSPRLRNEQGQAWIQSAKIARKAGYEQTAYSAALQAKQAEAPFAFIQAAKLVRANNDILKGLRELTTPINDLIKRSDNEGSAAGAIDLTNDSRPEDNFRAHNRLAKAVLLEARWSHEADRFDQNDIVRMFRKAIALGDALESPFFHLGRYYDTLAASATGDEKAAYNYHTCLNYYEALQRGVKYIYQTMPRLLTIWLDLGETGEKKYLGKITDLMERSRKVQTYQFLTALPQIVSRITHSNPKVREALVRIVYRVVRDYPAQTLWLMVGPMLSKRKDRQSVAETILKKAVSGATDRADLQARVQDAKKLSTILLKLAEDKPDAKMREAQISTRYGYVKAAFPSTMIMPLQDALTCVLPSVGSDIRGIKDHQAFPNAPVQILDIVDKVEIMPSLQQPKKLVFKGTDGKRYPFLCKPHDDLRKDARLMDLNSMINKFLNSASEGRRRHLYVRTYAVMPLNEDCGLLEWVSNTSALKSILEKNYHRRGRRIYSNDLYNWLDSARKDPNAKDLVPKVFKTKVLPLYQPTVFNEWFLSTWPEPTAWLTSRTNYARTLAVMSMIGYVLGLGDRHGENILFDGLSGDTVHVDLNCLFDKAKTFEVPERVPFRLTHNMVDALGVTGVEGVFRKAAEITMEILRSNRDSLMSVLEAFVHDPLVEWTKSRSRSSERDVRLTADKNLQPIQEKLRGLIGEVERTVPNQVELLIREATSPTNLGLMYVGWAAWL